jgi:hypothetical protein
MIIRALAVLIAFALLGASAHAIIAHVADGYSSPHAIVTLTLAAGVAVGALAIGAAWEQRRRVLACIICIALLCGEAFGLVSTAERIIAQRDGVQMTISAAREKHDTARRELHKAEAELARADTSDRLQRAEAAKAAADAAALTKAAERSCAANCRALLEQQVSAAAAEVDAARTDSTGKRNAAAYAVARARDALKAAPAPASSTPLADRLGLQGWQLDLLVAALGSLAVNGLAATLLVFAGHGGSHRPTSRPSTARAVNAAPLPYIEATAEHAIMQEAAPAPRMQPVNVREHAARFGVECFGPSKSGSASLDAVKARYLEWCGEIGLEPLPDATIGKALADLFGAAGVRVEDRSGRLVVVGVELKAADNTRGMLRGNAAELMRVVEHGGKTARGSQSVGQFMPAVS